MKMVMKWLVCAAFASAAANVPAVVPGVYGALGTLRFVVTADRAVATCAGEKIEEIGFWGNELVREKRYLVFRTWRHERFSPLAPEKIWIAEEEGEAFRIVGCSYTSAEDALDRFTAWKAAGRKVPLFKCDRGAFLPALERQVAAAATEVRVKLKAHEELVDIGELVERLVSDPVALLKVEPEYPELDPDEDPPGPEGIIALYPPRMHKVIEAIGRPDAQFTEKTLVAFLEKIDWNKGDVLAVSVLLNRKISPEVRRRYASKVFARIGKSDDQLIAAFLADERTPRDIVKAAQELGGCGPRTAGAIRARLAVDDTEL